MPITEKTLINPVNPYAVTKVAQDYISYVYYKSFGVKVIRLRTFNHEGPRRENVFGLSSYAYQIAKIEKNLMKGPILVGYLDDKIHAYLDIWNILVSNWKMWVGKLYLVKIKSKSVFTFTSLEKFKKCQYSGLKHKTHKPFVRPTNVQFLTLKNKFEKKQINQVKT